MGSQDRWLWGSPPLHTQSWWTSVGDRWATSLFTVKALIGFPPTPQPLLKMLDHYCFSNLGQSERTVPRHQVNVGLVLWFGFYPDNTPQWGWVVVRLFFLDVFFLAISRHGRANGQAAHTLFLLVPKLTSCSTGFRARFLLKTHVTKPLRPPEMAQLTLNGFNTDSVASPSGEANCDPRIPRAQKLELLHPTAATSWFRRQVPAGFAVPSHPRVLWTSQAAPPLYRFKCWVKSSGCHQ